MTIRTGIINIDRRQPGYTKDLYLAGRGLSWPATLRVDNDEQITLVFRDQKRSEVSYVGQDINRVGDLLGVEKTCSDRGFPYTILWEPTLPPGARK